MANKNYIKIEIRLTINEKSEYYFKSKAASNNQDEIKKCIDGITYFKEILKEKLIKEALPERSITNVDYCGEKIMIKSSVSDVVRIYEVMKRAEIISMKTTTKQITAIHYHSTYDQLIFEKKYNAIKSRLERDESSSNSEEYLNFIMLSIENGFKKKGRELEKLVRFIEGLQKNII